MKLILTASNIKIVSSNQRLKPSRSGHWFNNSEYEKSSLLLSMAFKLSKPLDFDYVFKKDIKCSIEIWIMADIDNGIKIILDCLKKCEIINDDKNIMELHVIKHVIKRGHLNKCIVTLED
jgi:hypothetical protein